MYIQKQLFSTQHCPGRDGDTREAKGALGGRGGGGRVDGDWHRLD